MPLLLRIRRDRWQISKNERSHLTKVHKHDCWKITHPSSFVFLLFCLLFGWLLKPIFNRFFSGKKISQICILYFCLVFKKNPTYIFFFCFLKKNPPIFFFLVFKKKTTYIFFWFFKKNHISYIVYNFTWWQILNYGIIVYSL